MILDFLKKDNIVNPPYDYYFLKNLNEVEYPKYLAKIFNYKTGEKLPLKYDFKNKSWIIDKKRCKTFNQKIQWIKLYGITDLMRKCTDKVAIRDYVAKKIGEEYLKPVLQVIPEIQQSASDYLSPLRGKCHGVTKGGKQYNNNTEENSENNINIKLLASESDNKIPPFPAKAVLSPQGGQMSEDSYRNLKTYFDQIDWEKLPNDFVIKCSHGCKWQYIIKNKEEFLKNKRLFEIVKRNMTGWLRQDYSIWGGFEMQYRVKSADRHCGQVDLNLKPALQSTAEKYNQPDCHVTQNAVVPRNDKYIEPKILIEPLLREEINTPVREIEVYCFNGIPKIINDRNADYEFTFEIFFVSDKVQLIPCNKNYIVSEKLKKKLEQVIMLSKELTKDFNFVRVDWMFYNNKPYFQELTFTPYSGFNIFKNKKDDLKLGSLLILDKGENK